MDKIKLKEIAKIQTGYSNKLIIDSEKKEKTEFLELKFNSTKKYNFGFYKLNTSTLKKLKIKDNSIIISSIKSNFCEEGKNHIGKYIGKYLFKIDVNESIVSPRYVHALFVSNVLNLIYEGTMVKILRIRDLENLLIPIPTKEFQEKIIRLKKYSLLLKKQKNSMDEYIKGIMGRINGKDN